MSYGTSASPAAGSELMESDMPFDAPPELPPAPDQANGSNRGKANLTVQVPEQAKVFINGRPTRTTGAQRTYASNGLQVGRPVRYEVRAEIKRDGEVRQQTRTAWLRVGETTELAFDFSVQPTSMTSLTLHVPEDATVTLAGASTPMRGARRVFETSKLKPGQKWSDYSVNVSVVRDGRRLTQQKTIALVGGESRDLSFNFDEDKIAAR